MSDDDQKKTRTYTRREMLGLLLIGGGATGLSIMAPTNANQLTSRIEPSESLNIPAPTSETPSVRYLQHLSPGPPVGGVGETFADAYSLVKVKDAVALTGYKGMSIPWMAVSIVGKTNELQIIDPTTKSCVHSLSLPSNVGHGIDSMVWDLRRQRLYLSVDSSVLMWDSKTPDRIEKLIDVAGSASLYSLTLDSAGNIWGGTYPLGSVFRFVPRSGEVRVFSRLAQDTDYVRSLAIDSSGNVWAGTGSVNPRIFTFKFSDPENVREVSLPIPIEHGFVGSLKILGNRVAASVSYVEGQLILDTRIMEWVTTISRVWNSWIVSRNSNLQYFTVSDGFLYATSVEALADQQLGQVQAKDIVQIIVLSGRVLIVSPLDSGLLFESFDLDRRVVTDMFTIPIKPAPLGIHSLMAHSDGKIYVGGFMGEGVASVSPDSGKRWISTSEESLINQIEGMVEFDKRRTYIGSYGYSDIIRFTASNSKSTRSYRRIARLGAKHSQSRPFGWAVNEKNVFFGTVPEYGVSGGVLGMIDPNTDEIQWLLDGDGEGFIRHHSIIGLAADESYLYGTTSIKGGLGAANASGPAKVFKFHIGTRKIIWESSIAPNIGSLYAPQFVGGWLAVADRDGISIIDIETGALKIRHAINRYENEGSNPGWRSADFVFINGGEGLIHVSRGQATMLDFASGLIHRIRKPSVKSRFGTRLTTAKNGKVYGSLDETDLVEILSVRNDNSENNIK